MWWWGVISDANCYWGFVVCVWGGMPEPLWLMCIRMCFREVDLDGVGQVGEVRCDAYAFSGALDMVVDL